MKLHTDLNVDNKKNQKVILTVGLPGSGKSTWAKAYCNDKNNHAFRVNRDELRNMLCQDFSKEKESIVITARNQIIISCLNNGYNVVVDDTNLNNFILNDITFLVRNFKNVTVEEKLFTDVDLNICIQRNSNRKNNDKVPDNVIYNMINKYPERFQHE